MSGVINLSGLRKEFPDVVAVKDIDLEVRDGEFFTLLGPSGSGKTTVLRMIAGLDYPTKGTVYLTGQDVTNTPPYNRDVNTVFQDYALFPHMTVEENISYGLEIRGFEGQEITRRVTELLELVSLSGLATRSVDELSGGQQQRVALARALAIEPQVLLLDEPLGALDEKLRREMQVELKNIQEELGTTFLYVTHDQEEALSMSDRIGVMDSGNLVQIGTPEEIYERPRTVFIAEFFRGSNIFSGTVQTSRDGKLVLSFAGTEIVADSPPQKTHPRNHTVKFFVRSENIEATDSAVNRLSGTVGNVVYRGSVTDYTVQVADHTFTVTLTDNAYSEGDDLTFSWQPQDTVLLSD